ncbi:MAG: hypothetical protein AAB495_00230 [Patescibacteria group bacterium]
MIDAELCLLRDEEGGFVGISVLAEAENMAERFCELMPHALEGDPASVGVQEQTLFFVCSGAPAACYFDLDEETAKLVRDFINMEGDFSDFDQSICEDNSLTPGFKIVISGKEDVETRNSSPIRSRRVIC